MKKLSIICMVVAMMATLTQCKKNLQVNPDANCQNYFISVSTRNNSKVNVDTSTGMVNFQKDDQLFVVYDGKYVGDLVHDGESFKGTITCAETGSPLYFYFLGNQRIYDLVVGKSTSCKVSIDDQKTLLPVISCGMSDKLFNGEGSYSTFLYNKCALVRFDVTSNMSTEAVCINGMNNQATIDFTTGSFTYEQKDGGVIRMSAGTGQKWAIVFPNNDDLEEGVLGSAYSADYRYVGVRPAMKAINENGYFTDGYQVTIGTASVADGMFTMNGNGKRVVFSTGNVQYIGSAKHPYWRFAPNQYDVLSNTASQMGGGEGIDRDRFGWGTGDRPNLVSSDNGDYTEYYEWGKHFTPVGGKEWHAPKCVEWEYVMFTRPATKVNGVYNARYARIRIDNNGDRINGLMLFPDVYNHPAGVALPKPESINYTNNNNGGSYTDNIYTVEEWALLEDAGCVFLPAGGQRIKKEGAVGFYDVNTEGHYWSQCDLGDPEHACNMYYTTYRPYIYDKNDKYKGFSVRLVHE